MRHLPVALACVLLAAAMAYAEPPAHATWEMTFHDEFEGTALNWEVWASEGGPRGPTKLEGRWPENNVVRDGLLHQITRRENPPRGGKEWSTASIWTKAFAQQYGYFECRMRYGKHLNNAFWLYRPRTARFPTRPYFEIDINEGHTPRQVAMTLHYYLFPDEESEGELQSFGKFWDAPVALDEDFHLYGCEWDEKLIVWRFDGQPVRVMENPVAHAPAEVRLSTVIMPDQLRQDGVAVDTMDGVSMDVDWVRVYRKTGDLFAPQLPVAERHGPPEITPSERQVDATGTRQPVFGEDFEAAGVGSLPPGWEVGARQPAVVADEPARRKPVLAAGNKVLRLGPGDYAYRMFDRPLKGRLEVELDTCMQVTTEGLLLVTLGDFDRTNKDSRRESYYTGDIGPYIHWQRGYLSYYLEDTKWTYVGRTPIGKWQHVRLVLDVGKGVFDLYAGGAPGEFVGSGAFRHRQAAARGLGLRHRGQGGAVHVDNVVVREIVP